MTPTARMLNQTKLTQGHKLKEQGEPHAMQKEEFGDIVHIICRSRIFTSIPTLLGK